MPVASVLILERHADYAEYLAVYSSAICLTFTKQLRALGGIAQNYLTFSVHFSDKYCVRFMVEDGNGDYELLTTDDGYPYIQSVCG